MDFRRFFIDFYDFHISYCKPPASQKERWSYVCTCWTFFGWVIFFSDPLDAKKNPPTNAARKSMNPCPRSSEAPIWKTSTSTGLMFTAMELAFDLVVVGIFVENPLQFVSLKVVFFGQWPLRCFCAQCWARFSTQKNLETWHGSFIFDVIYQGVWKRGKHQKMEVKLRYFLDFWSRKFREMTQLDF